ncbi:MAG TPA: hypothetical protein DCL95_08595 [Rhodospirillaceae bacterium]|jgi:hypothetical protein|nr:hypothetical protein [Rhodospirillaceae bacterium]MAX60913.1 hypothetical protein [Rhodospirillaceae bacterium]MAX65235.1 hypothetical protein [Rhodospirillaceae bacterium]MBB55650.1 hypothetical protein [Rhodospirillaceae bacterium]HAE02392.1 hypothetical protein [Rhodospirillaceae bacterium]|tara:strand:+ start:669 stop:1151 length:483 start_codon:yes stop_codon:yes gene_type:complete
MSENNDALLATLQSSLRVLVVIAREVVASAGTSPMSDIELRKHFRRLQKLHPRDQTWYVKVAGALDVFDDAMAAQAAFVLNERAKALGVSTEALQTAKKTAEEAKDNLLVPKLAGTATTIGKHLPGIMGKIVEVGDSDINDLPQNLKDLWDLIDAFEDEI